MLDSIATTMRSQCRRSLRDLLDSARKLYQRVVVVFVESEAKAIELAESGQELLIAGASKLAAGMLLEQRGRALSKANRQ